MIFLAVSGHKRIRRLFTDEIYHEHEKMLKFYVKKVSFFTDKFQSRRKSPAFMAAATLKN
jgi:hypothetical protein